MMKITYILSILVFPISIYPVAYSRLVGNHKHEVTQPFSAAGKKPKNTKDGEFRIESLYHEDYVLVPPEKKRLLATTSEENLPPSSLKNVYWTNQCNNTSCNHGSWYWEGNVLRSAHITGCLAVYQPLSTPSYFNLFLSTDCDCDLYQEWKPKGKRLCSLGKKNWCVSIGPQLVSELPRVLKTDPEYNAVLKEKTNDNKPLQQVVFNPWGD